MTGIGPGSCLVVGCSTVTAGASWCTEHSPMRWSADSIDRSVPPTEVERYPDGSMKFEQWLADGKLSRADGPAVVRYEGNESVSTCAWFLDGVLHREEAPARVAMWVGHWSETFFRHGAYVREDGPSQVTYRADGVPERAFWLSGEGQRHRVDGPAVAYFDAEGRMFGEEFCLLGRSVTVEMLEPYRQALDEGAPPEWALAFVLGARL